MAPKTSSMLPAVLSPVLSFWLINYLKEGNCRSYFENGKDKAVKRHLTSNDFFLNTCCILHSEVMPAEGTVRIKLYCLFVPTVATDVLYPLPVAGENSSGAVAVNPLHHSRKASF